MIEWHGFIEGMLCMALVSGAIVVLASVSLMKEQTEKIKELEKQIKISELGGRK